MRPAHLHASWYSREVWRFTSAGRLDWQEDKNGNTIEFTYNPDGTVQKIVDTQGREVAFSYSGGRLTEIDDVAGGRDYGYGYTNDRLTSFVDPDNGSAKPTTFQTSGHEASSGGLRMVHRNPVNDGQIRAREGGPDGV
ncbi:hypothetical protein BH24ACT26_BH24ACT26_20050 [soil metagenome]